jgi:membrane associated rhomboid family serine protease
MGIYNRDYYRESNRSSGGSWGLDDLTPVVKYLIVANVVVFLLQIFVVRDVTSLEMLRRINPEIDKLFAENADDPEALDELKKQYPHLDEKGRRKKLFEMFMPHQRISIVQEWCELDTNKVVYGGQVWRLLTHAFCHSREAIWHILFNMLFLYWFGCTLESMYGPREFLLFYLTAAMVAALAYIGLDLYTGSSRPAIGASGAVMGVTMLFTMHFPRQIMYVFWVIPIEMRWLMALYLIWDLHPVLLTLSGDRVFSGIAHAAHLGGLAFGFLYYKFQWRLDTITERIAWPSWRWRRRPRLRLLQLPADSPEPEPDADAERVDQLLQKIYETGQASLTDEERAILRLASDRLKSRGN